MDNAYLMLSLLVTLIYRRKSGFAWCLVREALARSGAELSPQAKVGKRLVLNTGGLDWLSRVSTW